MANDQESFNTELALPSILAVLLIILAAWLLWVTQVRTPTEEAAEPGEAIVEEPAEAAPPVEQEQMKRPMIFH